jgi:AcrR family transcriptional regulator
VEGLGAYAVEKSGSRRSSVERREEILKVALCVLAERGYRGASMREIAERSRASKETLYAWFGNKRGLFERLLLGERAVVINRAAISEATSDPTFARILAARGRGSVVPNLERYLEGQRERGRLEFEEAGTAIDALIGLTIGDQQVRRLLGALPMPETEEMQARAERAVRSFLALFGRERSTH